MARTQSTATKRRTTRSQAKTKTEDKKSNVLVNNECDNVCITLSNNLILESIVLYLSYEDLINLKMTEKTMFKYIGVLMSKFSMAKVETLFLGTLITHKNRILKSHFMENMFRDLQELSYKYEIKNNGSKTIDPFSFHDKRIYTPMAESLLDMTLKYSRGEDCSKTKEDIIYPKFECKLKIKKTASIGVTIENKIPHLYNLVYNSLRGTKIEKCYLFHDRRWYTDDQFKNMDITFHLPLVEFLETVAKRYQQDGNINEHDAVREIVNKIEQIIENHTHRLYTVNIKSRIKKDAHITKYWRTLVGSFVERGLTYANEGENKKDIVVSCYLDHIISMDDDQYTKIDRYQVVRTTVAQMSQKITETIGSTFS